MTQSKSETLNFVPQSKSMTSDVPQASNPDLTPNTPQENDSVEDKEGLEPLNLPETQGETKQSVDSSDQDVSTTDEPSQSMELETTIKALT